MSDMIGVFKPDTKNVKSVFGEPTSYFQIPEYICQPARTVEEAKELIEKGFSYECEIDDMKLFKKIK